MRSTRSISRDAGFTLIELLVVVLIIAVLAAIAIPGFLSQRENAYRSTVASDLHNAIAAAHTYATVNGGSFVEFDAADLPTNGYRASEGVEIIAWPEDDGFVMTATSTHLAPDAVWTYRSATGTISS